MKHILLGLLLLVTLHSFAERPKFDRGIRSAVFVPKGQWISGLSISYTEQDYDNYKFLVLDGLTGEGYSFKVSPMVAYTFRDNTAAGLRFKYTRTMIKLSELSIDLGDDMTFDIDDTYSLSHSYAGTGIIRTYINLGESRRFGLYNEVQLAIGGSQSKIVDGKGNELTGTYTTSTDFSLGMSPGLTAFISDFAAVEVSVGVLGFNYSKAKQVTDQIETGSYTNSSANFKINLFALELGMMFYL